MSCSITLEAKPAIFKMRAHALINELVQMRTKKDLKYLDVSFTSLIFMAL